MNEENPSTAITPFERIRRTNPTGSEFWSSRDFAEVIGYADYRNFEAVIEKARDDKGTLCPKWTSAVYLKNIAVKINQLTICQI
jgi:hypothetical protein